MDSLFSSYIHFQNLTFKYARGISDRTGKEFHIFHEMIYFLDGEGEFISENLHMRPEPDTLIVIPRETYHQMVIHGNPERYHRCLLQFPDWGVFSPFTGEQPERILAIQGDSEIRYLFQKLRNACQMPKMEASLLLNACLTVLLSSLKDKSEFFVQENGQTDVIRLATGYINRNLNRKILISDIANACNVSVSALTHTFKQEMNIPIHKFIVKKRLINAYHRISAGEPATLVALECGFNDYSGFYRQYRKTFGFPPSGRPDREKIGHP